MKAFESDLKVTALNINAGKNRELVSHCKTLREYMQYVECVRRYADGQGMTLERAVARAVEECIEKGILADFLRRNKEAISVSIFEYNEAEEKEKLRRAEYAIGYDDGMTEGIEKGIRAVIEDNLEEGIEEQKIIEKLKKRFGLTRDRAQELLEKYGYVKR